MIAWSNWTTILTPIAEVALKILKALIIVAIIIGLLYGLGNVVYDYISMYYVLILFKLIRRTGMLINCWFDTEALFNIVTWSLKIEATIWGIRGGTLIYHIFSKNQN